MKVWVIILKGEDERQKLRAYSKKEEAVAEMESLRERYNKHMRHTDIILEEVDGLLVMALYGDGVIRYEEAVMTELVVDAFKETSKEISKPGIIDNGWQPAPGCEDIIV